MNSPKGTARPSSVSLGGILNTLTRRGTYKKGVHPMVFINEHTKVICQGMTGKQVSIKDIDAHYNLGNISHIISYRIWNKDGGRCQCQEGGNYSPRSSGV